MPVIENLPRMKTNPAFPILNLDRTCLGINDIDILLKGGFEKPGNILIINDTKREKLQLLAQIAVSNIAKGTPVYIVTAEDSPDYINQKIKKMAKYFPNFKPELLFFVDCYSVWINGTSLKGKNIFSVDGPNALNEISLTLNKIIRKVKDQPPLFIFYSLSTFFLYNDENSFFKFLQTFNGKLRSLSASSIQFINKAMHSEKTMITAKYLSDNYIELSKTNEGAELIVGDIKAPITTKVGKDILEVI